jgi:AcrR family transcriptional regulator
VSAVAADAAPRELPRGRHGLTREQVAASQRRRLLEAMAEAMVQRGGYAATPVAEILRRAGVSRQTFYEQFAAKEDCFMAAFDAAAELLLGHMAAAQSPAAPRAERFAAVLGAYLDALAEHPAFARLFLVEVHAAGPAALRRRQVVQQRFAEEMAALLGAATQPDRFACEALVAAISAMVTARLGTGDVDGLRSLHAPLVGLVQRALATPG